MCITANDCSWLYFINKCYIWAYKMQSLNTTFISNISLYKNQPGGKCMILAVLINVSLWRQMVMTSTCIPMSTAALDKQTIKKRNKLLHKLCLGLLYHFFNLSSIKMTKTCIRYTCPYNVSVIVWTLQAFSTVWKQFRYEQRLLSLSPWDFACRWKQLMMYYWFECLHCYTIVLLLKL